MTGLDVLQAQGAVTQARLRHAEAVDLLVRSDQTRRFGHGRPRGPPGHRQHAATVQAAANANLEVIVPDQRPHRRRPGSTDADPGRQSSRRHHYQSPAAAVGILHGGVNASRSRFEGGELIHPTESGRRAQQPAWIRDGKASPLLEGDAQGCRSYWLIPCPRSSTRSRAT